MNQDRQEFVYTVCCFHPDARKSHVHPLAILEFKVTAHSDAEFQVIWWPSDERLKFLESQTNSISLQTTLLNFPREIPSEMRIIKNLKEGTILETLSRIVGCGNFSFTELASTGAGLDQTKVRQIMEQLEQPLAYQKILVPA